MLWNMCNRIICSQDENNNTDHTKTDTITGSKSNRKKKAPHPKSTKVRNIKSKHAHQDDDNDTGSPKEAKRKKIADATDIVPSKTIKRNERHHEASTSSSSSSTASLTPSDDSVIVIGDNSIDSYLSMDENSIANTTASSSKSDSSAKISRHKLRAANFNFDALQTDDETDEEDNIPYAPQWSKSKNRSDQVIDQEQIDPNIIDRFFGCRAESVDLMAIFPASAPIVRRRSTAVWKTPPRYSTLPKY